ncbi:hypothetical protein N9R80_00190 [bacterium]|nr:hypothetical protein [bacterium]
MAINTPRSNLLPDPNNPINDAGQADASGIAAGFISVSLNSEFKTVSTFTNSGRLITSSSGGHKWSVNVSYNPLTREDFEPVYNFLAHKKGRLTPFFMELPQNLLPRNASFATHTTSNDTFQVFTSPIESSFLQVNKEYTTQTNDSGTNWVSVGASTDAVGVTFTATDASTTGTDTATATYVPAGQDNITIANPLGYYSSTSHGTPRPGDLFTIYDSQDAIHTKLYKITAVETKADYSDTVPDQIATSLPTYSGTNTNTLRIHCTPALQRNVYSGSNIKFHKPKIRVVLKGDIQEYSLNNENLYTYSFELEEAQK